MSATIADQHIALRTEDVPWVDADAYDGGVARRSLYSQAGFSAVTDLERWAPNTDRGALNYREGAEIFVLDGEFEDELGRWSAGCWLRLPAGAEHRPRTVGGCTIYIKRGGLAYLRGSEEPNG